MSATLEQRRLVIRRKAIANLILVLRAVAERSGGRFTVDAMEDGVVLRYRDVLTLVHDGETLAPASRDFTIFVLIPLLWPFDREAALAPLVIEPHDFRHPNSDSRLFCLDLRGIAPERLPELLYDNIRLRNRNLGHCVDRVAAGFVRDRFPDGPVDERPLDAAREGRP
jgi:hypothetical protein